MNCNADEGIKKVQPDLIFSISMGVYTHLNKPVSTWRVIFFDFSSAFDTICPALLGDKLTAVQVDCGLPDLQTKVRVPSTFCVRQSGQQYRGLAGDCPLSLPRPPVHHGL